MESCIIKREWFLNYNTYNENVKSCIDEITRENIYCNNIPKAIWYTDLYKKPFVDQLEVINKNPGFFTSQGQSPEKYKTIIREYDEVLSILNSHSTDGGAKYTKTTEKYKNKCVYKSGRCKYVKHNKRYIKLSEYKKL